MPDKKNTIANSEAVEESKVEIEELQQEALSDGQDDQNVENLKKLVQEVKRLQEERDAKSGALLREQAENDNLRRRHKKELEDTAKYSVGEFAKDLVEVMESLYKAIEFKKEFNNEDSKVVGMFDGIEMTLKILEKTFTKYGISRIYPKDEDFDHRYHQAISMISVPDVGNNKVVDVIQAGYVIHDRLLKPALVVVNSNQESE